MQQVFVGCRVDSIGEVRLSLSDKMSAFDFCLKRTSDESSEYSATVANTDGSGVASQHTAGVLQRNSNRSSGRNSSWTHIMSSRGDMRRLSSTVPISWS